MRRIFGVATVAVLLVALATGAAYAVSGGFIQCTGVPCVASGDSDLVYERNGAGLADRIILRGGNDQVRADRFGNDTDIIEGGRGFDKIYVNDGDVRDRVDGGLGANDWCIVDAKIEADSGCSRITIT